MPDPINMSQEDQDRLAAEMRGISQDPAGLVNQAIEAQNIANANQAVFSSDAPVGGSVIPPGNTVGENIDQTVNPGGVSAQDLATIQQAKSLYTPAQQIPVTPTPSNAALMPTLNQPINVGTSSGQITGSHGVYVDPGFVAPWGAMMQKQAAQDTQTNLALKNQELAKKARDTAFKFERPATPLVDDPHFQKSLNESGRSLMNKKIDEAKDLYGPDWQVALKSDTRVGREFKAEMDGLNIIARNANLMTTKFAEIKAGIKDGSTYYSPGVLKSFREYEQAMGDFESGDTKVLGGVRQILERIDGEMELNNFLKDSGILTNVVAEVTGGTGISGMQDFMKLRTTDRKSYDKNINAMVENVRKAKGLDSSYTEADIRTALEGHFQNKSKSKTTLKAKKDGGGSGRMTKEDVRINEGSKELNVDNTRAGGDVKKYNGTGAIPLKQTKTGLNIDGLQELNLDGSTTPISNVQQVKPVELVYVDVTDDQGNVTKEKAVSIEYETEVPIKQSIADRAIQKPVQYEAVSVSKVVRYDDIKDQMKTIYGDPVNDAFEGSVKGNSRPEQNVAKIGMKDRVASGKMVKGDTTTEDGQTAVFDGTKWVMK